MGIAGELEIMAVQSHKHSGQTFFAGACVALVVYFLALLLSGFTFWDWAKAREIIASEGFRHSLWLSFWSASVATLLAVSFGLPAAWFLSRRQFRGRALVDALLDLPTFLSPIATGTLLLMLFHTSPGRWLQAHGLSVVYTTAGIVFAQFTIVVSLALRLLKSNFDAIPVRYENLARLLGCSPFQAFWRVAMPIARPGILAAVIVCWARAFGEFGATVTLAGAMPRRTETITTGIYLRLGTADLEGAVVLIMVLVLSSLSVLLALRCLSPEKQP